ncbi:hypothetical protein J6590_085526 [Homalodisca vitripennis]|nr:hypothetical protein J6590_085526 [Homalodisca vitripennis]
MSVSPTDLLPMDTRTTPWEPCEGVDVSLTMQRVCDRRQTTSDFAGTIPWDDIRSTPEGPVTTRRRLFTAGLNNQNRCC